MRRKRAPRSTPRAPEVSDGDDSFVVVDVKGEEEKQDEKQDEKQESGREEEKAEEEKKEEAPESGGEENSADNEVTNEVKEFIQNLDIDDLVSKLDWLHRMLTQAAEKGIPHIRIPIPRLPIPRPLDDDPDRVVLNETLKQPLLDEELGDEEIPRPLDDDPDRVVLNETLEQPLLDEELGEELRLPGARALSHQRMADAPEPMEEKALSTEILQLLIVHEGLRAQLITSATLVAIATSSGALSALSQWAAASGRGHDTLKDLVNAWMPLVLALISTAAHYRILARNWWREAEAIFSRINDAWTSAKAFVIGVMDTLDSLVLEALNELRGLVDRLVKESEDAVAAMRQSETYLCIVDSNFVLPQPSDLRRPIDAVQARAERVAKTIKLDALRKADEIVDSSLIGCILTRKRLFMRTFAVAPLALVLVVNTIATVATGAAQPTLIQDPSAAIALETSVPQALPAANSAAVDSEINVLSIMAGYVWPTFAQAACACTQALVLAIISHKPVVVRVLNFIIGIIEAGLELWVNTKARAILDPITGPAMETVAEHADTFFPHFRESLTMLQQVQYALRD